jgi:hypothetical protein
MGKLHPNLRHLAGENATGWMHECGGDRVMMVVLVVDQIGELEPGADVQPRQ